LRFIGTFARLSQMFSLAIERSTSKKTGEVVLYGFFLSREYQAQQPRPYNWLLGLDRAKEKIKNAMRYENAMPGHAKQTPANE